MKRAIYIGASVDNGFLNYGKTGYAFLDGLCYWRFIADGPSDAHWVNVKDLYFPIEA